MMEALIHESIDHSGKRTFPVWLYDTSKPRGLSDLRARYSAVRLLDVFRTRKAAERALTKAGIKELSPV